jgi:DNA polymerase-3 subunit delta'
MRDVIGQRRLLEKLGEQAIHGDVAHAYELSGPRSIGKNTVALRLAQTLNCTAEPRIAGGCGACIACMKIEKGIHPDVLMVTRLVDQMERDSSRLTRSSSASNRSAPCSRTSPSVRSRDANASSSSTTPPISLSTRKSRC